MPWLQWYHREDDLKRAARAPYRLLQPQPEHDYGDADSQNLLIQGDNLDALKSLLPYYAGQVKCDREAAHLSRFRRAPRWRSPVRGRVQGWRPGEQRRQQEEEGDRRAVGSAQRGQGLYLMAQKRDGQGRDMRERMLAAISAD